MENEMEAIIEACGVRFRVWRFQDLGFFRGLGV